MKEIRVCLQRLWLRCQGTFSCYLYFSLGNQKAESKLQGEGLTKIVKDEKCWKLGPIVDHGASDVINDLQNFEFTTDLIDDGSVYPSTIHLDIYQEVLNTKPSTSHDNTDKATHIQIGKGILQLTYPQMWYSSTNNYDERLYHHRISINSVQEVGSLTHNLGWLGITTLFLQKNEKDGVDEITSQICFEGNGHESPEVSAEPLSERLGLPGQTNKLEPTSFAFLEPNDKLPSIDAMQQILPMYYKLIEQPPQRKDSVKPYLPVNEPEQTMTDSQASGMKPIDVSDKNDVEQKFEGKKSVDSQVISVLEYQTKELDRYRQAIRQMGELVVSLRSQISELQMKNNSLRSSIFYSDNSNHTKGHRDYEHQDGSDFAMRNSMIEQIKEQKAMLQKQQNDLIVKNEYEKKYLKLLKAHQSQQSLLQELQMKLSKYQRLEKICKKQEKIIIELETNEKKSTQRKKASSGNPSEKPMSVSFQDDTVNNENMSLISRQMIPLRPQGNVKLDQISEVEDRMSLLQKLEKAEGRIMALEKQMFDNARLWAREKSQLKVKHAEGFPDMIDLNRGKPTSFALPSNQMDHLGQHFYHFPTIKRNDVYNRFSQL